MILVSLALAALIPPAFEVVDRAGSRVDMLGVRGVVPREPRDPSDPHCSEGVAPRWCVSASRSDGSGWTVTVANAQASRRAQIRLPDSDAPGTRLVVDSRVVRGADGSTMVGVIRIDSGGFSGGGWQTHRFILIRVTAETEGIVLDLPLLGSASIRACFDERDRRRRRDACTDEYGFMAGFELDTENAAPTPAFNVWTDATTYPGRRSRTEDSSRGRPLRAQDLVRWRDPDCTHRRRYRFDAAAGRYLPDSPVPACADYLDFE
ncbi:MAG TPA: hypothetical protein VF603_03435 [Allosphingosinicella sp.]|jgi:hypothetical protein